VFDRDQLVDINNGFKTQSLFLETSTAVGIIKPIMTLKEIDWEYRGEVLPSLRIMYMEEADPTEYSIAMRVFGSWQHWQKMCKNKSIMFYINKYREELEVKLRSNAVKSLYATAVQEGSKGTAAAKYIADKGYDKRKAGAPSKEEKAREMKVHTKISDEVKEDFERLELH